jgi:hypothetical protein
MGLHHSVGIAYGFAIPADTDIDAIDRALQDQPNRPDNVGYIVVGDCDQMLLVTAHKLADENTVTPLTPEFFARYEVPGWDRALHEAAEQIGCPDHAPPVWLVIHNFS